MTGSQHDNAFAILMFKAVDAKLDHMLSLLKEIHGRDCAKHEKAASLIPWDKLLPWVFRIFGPIIQSHVLPWLIAALQGLIAAAVLAWKAFTRGWIAF